MLHAKYALLSAQDNKKQSDTNAKITQFKNL